MSPRSVFLTTCNAFMSAGEKDRAIEMLDICSEVTRRYPLESIPLGMSTNDYLVMSMVESYYKLGLDNKASALGAAFAADLLETTRFYLEYFEFGKDEFDTCGSYIYYLADIFQRYGREDLANKLTDSLTQMIDWATGEGSAT